MYNEVKHYKYLYVLNVQMFINIIDLGNITLQHHNHESPEQIHQTSNDQNLFDTQEEHSCALFLTLTI